MLNLTRGGLITGCWTKITNTHDSLAFLDLFNNELDADTGITFIKSVDEKNGQNSKYVAFNNEDPDKLIQSTSPKDNLAVHISGSEIK